MCNWTILRHKRMLRMIRMRTPLDDVATTFRTTLADIMNQVELFAKATGCPNRYGKKDYLSHVYNAAPGFTDLAIANYYKDGVLMEPPEGIFYAVYGGVNPRTLENARAEASKLAADNPGETFYVMRAVSKFSLATVIETQLT